MGYNLGPLGEGSNDVRQSVVLALSDTRLQINPIPLASLQQPFVSRPTDVATTKEMRPNEIDNAWMS